MATDVEALDPEQLAAAEDHDRIHILESCVVTWTRQIKAVLKADPDEALKRGELPGPETELNFWTERATNLNSIHEQLAGASVQQVVTVLKLAASQYFSTYVRLADEVDKARAQANDNVTFLAPLRPRVEKLLFRCDATACGLCVSIVGCGWSSEQDNRSIGSSRFPSLIAILPPPDDCKASAPANL